MSGINFTPDPDRRIRVDLDTTMMHDAEVQIILSHLRAIQAVVDGAKPQGSVDPEPETCGAEHPSGNYWCTLTVHGDDEPHLCVYGGEDLVRWYEPPEWRQLVNDYLDEDPGESRAALSYVLSSLSEIAAGENWQKPYGELARIIAICEQQVGDGWQADPGRVKCDNGGVCDIDCLLDCFKAFNDQYYRWVSLGNRAASWLAHLTGESS